MRDKKTKKDKEQRENFEELKPLNKGNNTGLNRVSINLTIFSILLGLTFAYFIYFSHQVTGTKSDMASQISAINAINMPYPFSFLTITGHKEYYYVKRRDALRLEFLQLKKQVVKNNLTNKELNKIGKEIQRVITQIAYSFPYKRILEFKKDGSVTFNPNRQESIETKFNVNIGFLRKQINEIYNWNYSFTLGIKDGKERISEAMIVAAGFKDDYMKSRVRKYINSLIDYLEEHYKLAVPLGLLTTKYEYLLNKISKTKVILFSAILAINFLFGFLLPYFGERYREKKIFNAITIVTFLLGIVLLFWEALYSAPL